jgi:hypothetical protein
MVALNVAGRALSGTFVLAQGWMGVFTGDLAWFANPLYVVALMLVMLKCYRATILIAAACAAIGLLSYGAEAWWFAENKGTSIDSLGPAFKVWEISFLLLLLGALALWVASNNSFKPKPLRGSA